MATVAVRWEEAEGAASGRSRCRACGVVLRPADLIPIVGYLARRGRCRACGGAIPLFYPLAELAAGLIGAAPLLLLPPLPALVAALLGWILLQLALIDFQRMLLPDRLTLPLLAAGLAVAAVPPPGVVLPSIGMALFGAAIGYAIFCVTALLYERLRGRMGLGGGDAKLIAAAGAWLGPLALPNLVLVGSLSALAVAVASGALRRPGMVLPFGPHLALAFWLVFMRAQGAGW